MSALTHLMAQERILSGRSLDPDESAELSEHLSGCAQCGQFAAFHQELLAGIPGLTPAVTHAAGEQRRVTAAVIARLQPRRTASRFIHGTRAMALLFSAVALVALLAFAIVRLIPQQNPVISGRLDGTPTAVQAGLPTTPPAASATPGVTPNPPPTLAPALNLDAFASVLKVFPLMPGAQWIYTDTEYDTDPGAANGITRAVYEITDAVVDTQISGPGYTVHIQRTVRQISADPGWNRGPTGSGDQWYTIQPNNQVFGKNANYNGLTLEYQFPLAEGASWCPYSETRGSLDPAAPTIEPCTNNIGARIVSSAAPFQSAAGSFPTCYLLTDVYNTGNILQTFCDGVGIVARKFDHPGTRFGFSWELTSFTSPTAAPAPTPAPQLTDEQVLAKALLSTDQKAYCSWMILGYGTRELYAWAQCELQVFPNSAASVPVVIHLDSAGHYGQVEVPGDGSQYAVDVQRLFPPNTQSDILNPNLSKQSLEWGIAQRKAGVFNVPYVTLAFPMDIPGCAWKSEPLENLPPSTAPGLSGWKSVVQAGTGFSLSIPADWSASQSGWDCGTGLAAPYYLALQPPNTHYQLTIGFRRPDQPVYITRTGTPAGDFVDAGQVSFFRTKIPASRLVYQGRDMAVFYSGSSEFPAGGNLFTLSLDITSDPKNNQSIPQDVEDQARQILASFQPYPTAAPEPTATPLAAQPTAQPLTLLAQRGGSAKGLALSGATAYVGIGPRLVALDVSDPAAPRLLAQSPALPGAVSGVLLFPSTPKNTAAVVSAGRTIEILDVTQPDKIVGWNDVAALPGDITAMVLDRTDWVLYVGGRVYQSYDPNSGPRYSGYVAVIQLYLGTQLGQVLPLTGAVESLALTRSTLYAAHADDQGRVAITGVPLLSMTQLGQPVNLAVPDVPAVSFSIQAAGDRLYIDSYDALVALDISDPMAPKEQWRSHLGMLAYGFIVQPGHIDAMGLAPVGDYALEPVRITPDEAVQTDPQVSTASNVASAGATTYLARDGLEIFDTRDPQTARPLGAYQSPLLVTIASAAQGDLVYTLDTDSFNHNWSQYLHVLRLLDMQLLSGYLFTGADDAPGWEYFYSMEIEGNRLYLFDTHQGTWVFGLSDPLQPAYLNRPSQLSGPLSAATTGTLGSRRLVFMASPVDTSSTLAVYNVTDMNNITVLSSLDLKDETPQRLAWSGGLLYAVTQGVSASGNGFSYSLEVFSLENNTLKLQSRTPLAGDSRMAARGSLAALSSPDGLVIYSAADPAHPQILSQTPLAGGGAIPVFQGNHLLVALQGSSSQLLTFDVSDLVQPRLLSDTDVPSAENISVSGQTITLSSNHGGIEVLR